MTALHSPRGLYFCPSLHEVPAGFRSQTEVFGMGPDAARALATKLNQLEGSDPIVIFGSAGALNSQLRAGQVFLVTDLKSGNAEFQLPYAIKMSERSQNFRSCRVFSHTEVARTPEEKKKLFNKFESDLVDCEMTFIFENVSEPIRNRLLFVRGIIDEATMDLSFLENEKVQWKKLIRPKLFLSFLKLILSWRKYLSGMQRFLMKIDS